MKADLLVNLVGGSLIIFDFGEFYEADRFCIWGLVCLKAGGYSWNDRKAGVGGALKESNCGGGCVVRLLGFTGSSLVKRKFQLIGKCFGFVRVDMVTEGRQHLKWARLFVHSIGRKELNWLMARG